MQASIDFLHPHQLLFGNDEPDGPHTQLTALEQELLEAIHHFFFILLVDLEILDILNDTESPVRKLLENLAIAHHFPFVSADDSPIELTIFPHTLVQIFISRHLLGFIDAEAL